MSLGPVPPFTNPPIEPQYYAPSVFQIADIALGQTTVVTTTVDHNYVVGQTVRLHIPSQYGSTALSGQTGYVITIPSSDSVQITLSSINVTPYIASPTYPNRTLPQICAVGDVNSGPINAQGRINNGTFIPGSFIDVSPF